MGLKEGQEVRPSDMPSTISGSFALQIRRAMAETPTDGSYNRSPNWIGILSIALPGIAVLVTQL